MNHEEYSKIPRSLHPVKYGDFQNPGISIEEWMKFLIFIEVIKTKGIEPKNAKKVTNELFKMFKNIVDEKS